MNTFEFSAIYWDLYLNLEADLIKMSDYIAFCDENKPTFSIELLKQLLAIGSEFDIVCKSYCELLGELSKIENRVQDKHKDILFYAAVFSQEKPSIFEEVVQVKVAPDYFTMPMDTWKCNPQEHRNPKLNCAPEWWWAYTQNKHNRNGVISEYAGQEQPLGEKTYKSQYIGKQLFQLASLEHVIDALASLFILEMYYYKDLATVHNIDVTIPQKPSRMFYLLDWETHIVPMYDVVSVNSTLKFERKPSKKDLEIFTK